MRARVQANGPCMEDVEVKIELSMPIRHWRLIVDQMAGKTWPADELHDLIVDAIGGVLKSVDAVVAGKAASK